MVQVSYYDPEIDTPKMKATLLVVLTAGVFTNPGTALEIDQKSCNFYMDFLKPAVESAFSMSTITVEQLRNPSRTDSLPFNKLSEADQGNDRSSDIFIYCDQKRLQQNTEGQWIDMEHRHALDINHSKEMVPSCEGSTDIEAWTAVYDDGAAIIQLCPWFMQHLLKQFQNNGEYIYITPDALNTIRDLSTRPPPSTLDKPLIDYFCVLDHTILHELSHTPLGGRARDIAYGWANIGQLRSTDRRQNADSYAYMGLGKIYY
ncbi:hypothetical protein Egran_05774 [Elaphomyces granulatus]|uniref:Lysine-specific metallo-endopeptidase domain-containing protein n=1 Tax=Elaphomyces granulatus TaxID=519963 RepID=A0A232LRM9_9EURO|nr:hypothetical protein Egran_05774 [Elaphomyces granulatus]